MLPIHQQPLRAPGAEDSAPAPARASGRGSYARSVVVVVMSALAMVACALLGWAAHDSGARGEAKLAIFSAFSPREKAAPASAGPLDSLRAVAPKRPLVGTAYNDVRLWKLDDPAETARYESVLLEHFGVITAENVCKPSTIAPNASGPLDFARCDRVLELAEAHGLKFRLHVLGWGEWNPKWMTELPPDERRGALLKFASAVLERYGERAAYIDVMNEAVCDKVPFVAAKQNCDKPGVPAPLKPGQWVPSVPDYIDEMFALARKLAPSATLVYNDYGFESDEDPADSDKWQRVYDAVSAARARGVPIDAVGLQLHISSLQSGEGIIGIPYAGWMDGLRSNMHRLAQLGVELHVTELDVGCNMPTVPCSPIESAASRDAVQARVYAEVLRACLHEEACTVFQTWGFTDKFSWRDGRWGSASEASWLMDQHAHMFDEHYEPKPAAFAIRDVLRNATTSAAA